MASKRQNKLIDPSSIALYARVLSYLKPYRKQFFLALLCMVFFGASDGAVPLLVKHILDDIFKDRNTTLLYVLPGVLVGLAAIRALLDFAQQFWMSRIGHLIVRDIRNAVNSHILSLSSDFFLRHESGDLIARITADASLARSLLTDCVAAILRDSIRIVALLGVAFFLDPVLALLAFVLFPIGIIPVYRFGRKVRKLSKVGQDAVGRLGSILQEIIQGQRVVKIFGGEQQEIDRFSATNAELTKTFIGSERSRALGGPVNEVLASLVISLVVIYGGFSVIQGTRTQGDFIAFLLSVFLLYDPFKKLSRVHNLMQQGLSGLERVFEILDRKPSIVDPPDPQPLPASNELELNKVSFAYEPGKLVLRDISLRVPPGALIALVGLSGAGKSTLVDLIPRFIDPIAGNVRIGGIDIARLKLCELRSKIAMVGQHTFLFNDSIYNNIAYGSLTATKDQVVSAAKAAYAFDFISALPQGFHTVIGEGGFSLSGGERQRIAIARALLKNAPILILDEATASLDNQSEREVQSALETLQQSRTTLVIAHRLSTVRRADLIVVLRDGQIVEQGKHEELLRLEAEYAKLYALQFQERHESSPNEAFLN